MLKTLSISSKLVLSVAISIIMIIAIITTIISMEVSSFSEKEAKDSIFLSSKRYANYMEGMLNEEVVLTKAMATSLNEIFSEYEQVDINLIESFLRNTFDSSGYAAYAFLYLKDPSVLSDTRVKNINFRNPDSKDFAMIFFDETTGKAGGIKHIKAPEHFSKLEIIQKIEKNARYGDLDTVFIDSPAKLNFDNNEFLGINLGMPIFNNKGKIIGVVGFTFDFLEISQTILDPKLDFYENGLRILITDQGIITIHANRNAILKNLLDFNKDPSSKLIIDAIKDHKDLIIDNYTDSNGRSSYASVASFSTLGNSSNWSMVVTAPKESIFTYLYKLQFIILSTAGIVLIIALCIIFILVRKMIGTRLPILVNSLERFFHFLNHEKIDLQTIKVTSYDELGKMGKMINENILATKRGLE
ncbi:cache domain-containing protein, partial [Campylobacter jejuni]|nr:cache domain-containing protein [Campylobacter jejuni]